jgi:CDP-diacylglycerol pyrophosphatase
MTVSPNILYVTWAFRYPMLSQFTGIVPSAADQVHVGTQIQMGQEQLSHSTISPCFSRCSSVCQFEFSSWDARFLWAWVKVFLLDPSILAMQCQ